MLTRAWTKLEPHYEQSRLWYSPARFKVALAGRGSGKSEVARRYIVRNGLPMKKPWPDPMYLYGMPTYAQAKRVGWNKLCDLIPDSWIATKNASELKIETVFGSSLYVMGLDKPERAEGVQWDGVVLDESSDLKPGVFGRSLLPAMSHRNAWCWRIGVPKRFGIGSHEFKRFYDLGLEGRKFEGTDDVIESYNWPSSDILTPSQLAFAASSLDPSDFNEQYNANWETVGGQVFHAFHYERNVTTLSYNPDLPIIVGVDFNVNPMCWVLAHEVNGVLCVFDEIFIRHCNTLKACETLHQKYPNHSNGFHFYGDAAGGHRSTSGATVDTTDYVIMHDFDKLRNKRFFVPRSNPRVQKRYAHCNAAFYNAIGQVRCVIDSSCTYLIRDLEEMAYKDGTNEPLKRGDASHMSDGLGYIIVRRFPIRLKTKEGVHRAAVISA